MEPDPKRETRLRTVRAAARGNFSIPPAAAEHMPPILAPKKQKQPRQALGVRQPPRKACTNPIKPEVIQRIFEGDTAVLCATGPSLTAEVAAEVAAAAAGSTLRVFGCNDSYRLLPLDVHYACDFPWWREYYEEVAQLKIPGGMWTQEPAMDKSRFPLLRRIAGCSRPGLSTDQGKIHFGNNSGYQLVNLAYLFGIKRILLCGYNMRVVDGRKHFFGDHPQGLCRGGGYAGFVRNYETMHPEKYGLEIINATPNSALHCFKKMALSEALAACK